MHCISVLQTYIYSEYEQFPPRAYGITFEQILKAIFSYPPIFVCTFSLTDNIQQ